MNLLTREDLGYVNRKPSNEVFIKAQYNDPFIKEAEELLNHMKAEVNAGEPITKLKKELASLFQDRFGLKLEFMDIDTDNLMMFYTYIPQPKINNGLFQGKTIARELERDLEELDQYIIDSYGTERELYEDWKKELTSAYNSIDFTDGLMLNKGINIDLNKAYIHGLNDNIKANMGVNFHGAFNKSRGLNLEPRELLAIIMHEYGHAWSGIANTYISYNKLSVFAENIKNATRNSDDPKKAVIIAYNKTTGERNLKESNVKGQDGTNTLIICLKEMLKMEFLRDGTNINVQNHEQMADYFASRFGLAGDLATALQKVMSNTFGYSILPFNGLVYKNIILKAIQEVIRAFYYVFIGIPILICVPIAYMVGFITGLLLGWRSEFNHEHPETRRRMVALKNRLVEYTRQNKKLTSEERAQITKQAETIDKAIRQTSEYSETNFGSVLAEALTSLSKSYREKLERRNLHENVDRMVNNDLHLAVNKMKQL